MKTFGRAFRFVSAITLGGVIGLCGISTPAESVAVAGPAGAVDGGVSPIVAHGARGEVVPPDLDDLEHMCALLTSCDNIAIAPGSFPADIAACVKKMATDMTSPSAIQFSLTMRECGLMANSCADLRTCALRGAKPGACVGRGAGGAVGFCDDDGRALTCWHDTTLQVIDCDRGGQTCILRNGQSTCTLGSCPADIAEGQPAKCSPSGTHTLRCEKGKLAALDCAAFGLTCAQTPAGAACTSKGPACTDSQKRCDGQVSVGCFNGHEVRVDCAAAGLVCNAGASPNAQIGACAMPPEEHPCKDSDAPKCDNGTIKYCFNGKPRNFLCKALGFNKCDTSGKVTRCAN